MRGNEFAELSAFVVVAEHRSFTKAASHLGIKPPTLSHSIRSLEERLGVRLLNRTTRSVALTEAGERLLAQLQPAMDSVADAVESVNAFRDKPVGVLRVRVIRPAAMMVVAPLFAPFLAAYPGITLDVAANMSDGDIVSEHFDAGIDIGERIRKDMIAVRLIDDIRFVAVGSPDYLARHPPVNSPEDLRGHNCIRLRPEWSGSIQPWEFERASQRLQVAVEGSLIVNDASLALSAAVDGIGIAYLAGPIASAAVAGGRLVRVLEEWSPLKSGLFVYYSSRRQMPGALRVFVDFLRQRTNPRAAEIGARGQPAALAPALQIGVA